MIIFDIRHVTETQYITGYVDKTQAVVFNLTLIAFYLQRNC